MTPAPSDGTPLSRLHKLHEATLHLFDLFASHTLEQDMLQKSIDTLTAFIEARYGAIGIVDEHGKLAQFIYTGITPEQAARIGRLPEGRGVLEVVIREGQTLRIEDIGQDPRSAGFPPNHPTMKSLLAVPIVHEGRGYGRLYLSEKTNEEPFNDDDEILTKHYADALALVLAYHRSQTERRHAEETLRETAQALSATTGDEFFPNLVLTLSRILGVDYALVGEIKPGQPDTIRTIAFCNHGRIINNIDYHVAPDTPCGSVECKAVCHFPEDAHKLFPEDDLMYRYGVEAFIGHPLLDSTGRVIGLLVAMHEKPIADKEHIQSLLQICAGRAAAELERRRIDRTLNEVAQAVSSVTGEEFFKTLVLNAAKALQVKFAFVGELISDKADAVSTVAVNAHGRIADNFVYELHGTPCRNVVGKQPCQYPSGVQQQFTEDRLLAEMNIESYVGYPLFDSTGRPLGLLAVMDTKPLQEPRFAQTVLQICASRAAAEIERRRSDQALRESEEHYHVLTRLAPVGIFRTDAAGDCTYANKQWCDIAGINPEQAYGDGWALAIHPDDRKYISERWYAAAKNDTPFQEECRMQRPDGVTTWVLAQASAERGPDDRVTGYVGTVTNITARKQAEAEMRKLSSVVEQTADSVVITDRDGVIQYVNPAYEAVTGYTREEAVGKKTSILKSGMHDKPFYERLWSTISRGEVFRERFINRRKNGSLYHEEKTITPLKNESGDITHFVSTGKDITARVLSENENRRMQTFLNSVVENLPNMLFVKDARDLRFVRFNKAAEELLGFSRDEMLGKNDHDFFTREEADFFISKDRQVLNSGRPQDIPEEPIHTRHKGVRLLHTQKIPILDESGKPLYLLGISEDITERKRVEEALARSAAEWTYSMDFIEDAMYLIDTDDRVVRANKAFYQLTGLSPEQTIGRDIVSIMHPQGEPAPCRVCQARHARRDCHIAMEPQDPDNPTGRPIEVTMRIIRDAAGAPTGVLMIIRDLTSTRETERVLRESETRLAYAQRIAHLGNWDWNIVTNKLYWSDEIYRIFGLTSREFGATFETFLNSVHPEDRTTVIESVNKALYENQHYNIDHRIVRSDGTERIVHEQAEVTFDESGKAIRMIGTVQDITEYRQSLERLNYLAYYDTLTGLPNRQLLNDHIKWAMKETARRERLMAVMFLDLDRFKNINDTLGHDVGDALLQEVATRLRASVRPGDIVSRLGGDEFTLVLANVAHIDDVTRVAQKLLDQFLPPFRIAGRDLFISPSIGITLYPIDDNSPENLLKNADIAMYHAKQLGRNNFQFYTPELNMRAARRLELETGLRLALERNEFILHYQPLVKMDTGKITGMEALLRWQHPEYGLIPPMEFIPLAEETGLIVPIGEWVLHAACAQIKDWHDTGFPAIHVAVNLSSVQLQQKNFAKVVKRVLSDTGLDPQYLDLELTESLLMQDMEAAEAILKELNDFGVLFSLDDFGTGYSSLSYLKRFPIDFLKIDRSFVRDITHDRYGAGIVRAIIAMAHTLDIKVIAEGVETAEQLRFLREQSCDISQGYFCSEPLDTETFTDLLRDWKRIRMGKCSIRQTTGKPRKNEKKIKSPRRARK